MNQYEAFAKKKNAMNYKQMLDQQVNLKNQFKMYGNMSSVEKAMNRGELHAYKNYDQNQYSMVPGVSSTKAIPGLMNSPGIQKAAQSPPKKAKDFESDFKKKQDVLAQLGYNNQGVSMARNNANQGLSEFAGRNFQGAKQHQSILEEYNSIAASPLLPDTHSGGANLNVGERQRQLMRVNDMSKLPNQSPGLPGSASQAGGYARKMSMPTDGGIDYNLPSKAIGPTSYLPSPGTANKAS